VSDSSLTFLGLDVHRDWISVAVLRPGEATPALDKVFHDEVSVRRLVERVGSEGNRLHACYEAGPTGYDLARLLGRVRVRCDVVAPSLIPRSPGDKVKTDKRDAARLARLLRAGELTAIRVPAPQEEAVRDLCRARADMVIDLGRARQRLGKFLLRHGRVFRDGTGWTVKHRAWIDAQRFDDAALTVTFQHYRGVLIAREAAVYAVEADLARYYGRAPFAEQVRRLAAYRGITELGGLTLAAEICDWRRFPTSSSFMGFCGLVPSEYSSGQRVVRGHITRAGNRHVRTQLIESAWAYQHHPNVGARLRSRHDGVPPDTVARAWAAQQRLCRRFRQLGGRKDSRNVVVTAIARELAGFVWAEMTAPPDPSSPSPLAVGSS
jgi:transposase